MKVAGRIFLLVLLATPLLAGQASAAATPVIAAYEKYVPGNGFDIGLVNAATGATLLVPTAVNTAADEFHPALTPDGRYLVFTRTTLAPQPDGDVVPPAARSVVMVDRQTGQVVAPFSGRSFEPAAGATIVPVGSTGSFLAYGLRVEPTDSTSKQVLLAGGLNKALQPPSFQTNQFAGSAVSNLEVNSPSSDLEGTFTDVPHAAVTNRSGRFLKALGYFRFQQGNGDISAARTILIDQPASGFNNASALTLPLNIVPRHATPRAGDGHVALDTLTTGGTDIHTIQFPGDSATTLMRFPVFTALDERMPAWSPDGVQLGFVRTTEPTSGTPRRRLLVFDSTTGVQDIVNPAVDLGEVAPTFKLRAFQDTWGALALANTSGADSVLISCGLACTGSLSGQATGSGVALTPRLETATRTSVGIIIARIAGTRRLFGRRVPRIRAVGKVPLGATRSRRPRFRWNARVNGRRLAPGNYLLTFRALSSRNRVLATSRSIRFRLTAAGRVTGARPVGP
jgi:hypothetical protein